MSLKEIELPLLPLNLLILTMKKITRNIDIGMACTQAVFLMASLTALAELYIITYFLSCVVEAIGPSKKVNGSKE